MPDTFLDRDGRRRSLPVILSTASCLLALAGCGSSNQSTSASGGALSNQSGSASGATAPSASEGLKFSQCMRAHGLANFPDPSTKGGGFSIQFTPGSGIDPRSPAFQSAQAACGKLMPGAPITGTGAPSPAAKAKLLALSKCMRANGVTAFPDPTTHPPSSPAGYAAVMIRDGVSLAIPTSVDMNSPVFKQAQTKCGFGVPVAGGVRIVPKSP